MFPAAVVAFLWVASTFFPAALAAAYLAHGTAAWIVPTTDNVVAECYPLTVQFTTPVAARNVSFFYYVPPRQGLAEQTVVEIASWPESTWKDASTVYTANSASVPVAAGTMIALRIVGYDDSTSFLNKMVVQPNIDTSCITAASQSGIPTYNGYPAQPASTTVSPTKPASTSPTGDAASPVAPPSTTLPPPSTPSTTSAAKLLASPSNTPSAPASPSPSSVGSATLSSASNSFTPTPSAELAASSNTPSAVSLPADVSSTSSKQSSSAIIAVAIIAALIGLIVTAAAIAWLVRRHNRRRMAEKREAYAAQPYDVPPPPIQEVDAGSFTFGEPERLPPQYDEISGPRFSNVQGPTDTTSDSGKGRRILHLR